MDIRAYFNSKVWKFAKTYADFAPHEYIVKSNYKDTASFEEAVRYIRKFGFPAKFGKDTHIYLPIDGRYYWTMGAPVEETVIINRCDISDYETVMYYNKRKEDNN